MNHSLFHIDEIEEGGSRGFECVDSHGSELGIIAIKKRGQIYLYHNSCPHIGIRLEWQPHQFLDADKVLIQCANHGALFTIDKGLCVTGPCGGDKLSAIAYEIRDKQVFIALD